MKVKDYRIEEDALAGLDGFQDETEEAQKLQEESDKI